MRYETKKLLKVLKDYGTIIVGVDFDDTVFPLNDTIYIRTRCNKVVTLLKELKDKITICLYSVAGDQSLKYKKYIMETLGIKPAYINESPIKLGNEVKPYFNILLDDKAGLNEAIEILTEFKNKIHETN